MGKVGDRLMSGNKLFVSFSGGLTSAFMTKMIMDHPDHFGYDDVVIVFANTGQELDETLDFVHRCEVEFGWNVVWVEAVTHHGKRKGCTAKVVSYETAARISDKGGPFESMISKYGIPNKAYNHCTRELKLNPMLDYIKRIKGWRKGEYDTAVGIRTDESRRSSKNAGRDRIVYPLIDWMPSDKIDVNDFWDDQPFTLEIDGYQGNCAWCWKKSFKKLFRIATESPEVFEFPHRMERVHGLSGHNEDGTRRVFFRENRSSSNIVGTAKTVAHNSKFASFEPERIDESDGCSESCEIVFE
jgi:3'-phosphoadenosine 5'-phosphosulfate sulfotransferase (PAPS reductase)/FAD synthetase